MKILLHSLPAADNSAIVVNTLLSLLEMEDEGGFSLKKLIKNQVQKKDNKEEKLLPQKRSLDFPPGLVGEPSEPIGRWEDLMKIIETYTSTKRQKTQSDNSYV